MPADLRTRLEAAIELALEGRAEAAGAIGAAATKAILLLDQIDGDPDFEPWLGSSGRHGWGASMDQRAWSRSGVDDREHDDEREEEAGDMCWWPDEGPQLEIVLR